MQQGTALYAVKAHTGPVTQMRWNEEFQQLITGGKDKTIKVWQLPDRWINEGLTGAATKPAANMPTFAAQPV